MSLTLSTHGFVIVLTILILLPIPPVKAVANLCVVVAVAADVVCSGVFANIFYWYIYFKL